MHPTPTPSLYLRVRKTHLSYDKPTGNHAPRAKEPGNELALGTGRHGFQETLRLPEEQQLLQLQAAGPVRQGQDWGRPSSTTGEKNTASTIISGAGTASISRRKDKYVSTVHRVHIQHGRMLQQHPDSANKPTVNRTVRQWGQANIPTLVCFLLLR